VSRWPILLVLLACAPLAGCGRPGGHHAHGEVREVDAALGQVVVAHDEIPGLMPAMTMSFDVADPALLGRLAPGQRIEFELEAEAGRFRILSARAEGERAGAVRAPLLAATRRPHEPAPDFALVDQAGRPLTLGDLRGKILLVDFVFTRCTGPCPILTGLHVGLQRSLDAALRERVRFVSITLDPAHDTPEVLSAYARARGADLSGWSFLTGPPAAVEDVVRRWGVGTLRAADGSLEHVVATFLVDGRGRIAERWIGLEHSPDEIRAAIAGLDGAAPAG
jgi:protein SCO1/2